MPPRKSTRRPARKNRQQRRRKVVRKRGEEFASAKQTVALKPDAMNVIWSYNDVSLAAFDRLTNIGKNYQYFRLTKVEMRFLPLTDTFIQNATATNTVPYLHWLINKGDNLDVADFGALRDAGAKPIRFDDKSITVKFRPAVHQFVADKDSTGVILPNYSMYKLAPWLATNQNAGTNNPVTWAPSTVEHYGILYGVEQDITMAGSGIPFNVEVTVHAQFKKPLNSPGSTITGTNVVQNKLTIDKGN